MANAITRIAGIGIDDGAVKIALDVFFVGPEVPNTPLNSATAVALNGTESVTVVRSMMSTAVSALAVELGFTCVGGNMILPTFQKG